MEFKFEVSNLETIRLYFIPMDNTLKLIREIKGLKQASMAELLGVSQSAYSKIERGITRLSQEQKNQLYEKLGISTKPDLNQTGDANSILFMELTKHYKKQLKFMTEENERLMDMLNILLSRSN